MEFLLPLFVVITMFAVLGVLILGLVNVAKGGNPRRSNKLMQYRVVLQGVALLLFALFMMLFRH